MVAWGPFLPVRPQNVRKPFAFLINYHMYFRLFQGRRQGFGLGAQKNISICPPPTHTQKNAAAALLNLIFFALFLISKAQQA